MTNQELLQRYQELGFRLLYWDRDDDPSKWKGPSGLQAKSWNDPAKTYPIEAFDPTSMNLGLFTGFEIAPGRFLADYDFDWTPGLDLARKLIPSTGFALGRVGKKISHAFITTPERFESIKYCDFADDEKGTGEGDTFIELRSGDFTHQTMIAPSLHSPGVFIELVLNGKLLHVELLAAKQSALDYAIGCLLLKRIPNGLHHDGRIALAGFLIRGGLSSDRVTAIIEEVCGVQVSRGVPDMSSKDVADAALVVRSTLQKLERGKRAAGGPTFAEYIGGNVGKFVLARLNKWLGRDDDFVRDKEGKIVKDNQENVRRAVEVLGYDLSYQEFSEKTMVSEGDLRRPLDDRTLNRVWLRIDRELRFRPSFVFFEKVVSDTAFDASYHPVRDYLAGLKWDGTPRINHWLLNYGGAEEHNDSSESRTYLEAVSAIPLIAAVRRVMKPGSKYDEMLILESSQGFGKSSALRALCPNEEWFSDDLPLNCDAKEIIERTLGKWIIEASDLTGGRKADRDHLKSMLSRQVDGPARMAYAHVPVERQRHFIIVGTTNSSEYLPDTTGARRFWPVRVQAFDLDGILRDRDQLWAEAVVREAAGESIRLPQELWNAAGEHQDQRREVDAWEQTIKEEISLLRPASSGRVQIAADVIWGALGVVDVSRRDRLGAKRIAEIMQRFGFKRTNVRSEDGKKVVTGYVRDPGMTALENVEPDSSVDELISDVKTEL